MPNHICPKNCCLHSFQLKLIALYPMVKFETITISQNQSLTLFVDASMFERLEK